MKRLSSDRIGGWYFDKYDLKYYCCCKRAHFETAVTVLAYVEMALAVALLALIVSNSRQGKMTMLSSVSGTMEGMTDKIRNRTGNMAPKPTPAPETSEENFHPLRAMGQTALAALNLFFGALIIHGVVRVKPGLLTAAMIWHVIAVIGALITLAGIWLDVAYQDSDAWDALASSITLVVTALVYLFFIWVIAGGRRYLRDLQQHLDQAPIARVAVEPARAHHHTTELGGGGGHSRPGSDASRDERHAHHRRHS